MKRLSQNKGFTLVELLVVVIMIGVLASIAIPKYFRAVERSRGSEGASLLAALFQAEQRYQQKTGAYTATAGDLDTDAVAGTYFAAPATDGVTAAIVRNATSWSTLGHSCPSGYIVTLTFSKGAYAANNTACNFILP